MARPERAPIPGMDNPAGAHEPYRSPLKKPPEGFRDPSEFEGADKTADLTELNKGRAALELAVKEARAKETILREKPAPPESPLGRAQEQLKREKIADTLFNTLADKSAKELATAIQKEFQGALERSEGPRFLASAQEVLNRFKTVAGFKEGAKKDGAIIYKPEMARFLAHIETLKDFIREAPQHFEGEDVIASSKPPEGLEALDKATAIQEAAAQERAKKKMPAAYEEGDVLASTPPPKETREAGPPSKPLPGGVKIRGGMGVKVE
ncbi:MAG: hypothetical protein HY437_01830 [Candidatus Magasanikbacteria bacterium]|nr:hypothetical protein [Candidatus Magasanikbacteria bacterium]